MTKKNTFYVVFDANIIIQDFWLSSSSFQYLIQHHFLGHSPVIPYVAFQEAKAHFKRRAEELFNNVGPEGTRSKGNIERLERLLNRKINPKKEINIDAACEKWSKFISQTLEEFNGRVLPSIESSPQTFDMIIERSINRIRPFSNGDRGFRDTIIWLSTLQLSKPLDYVSFITKNVNDFFDKDCNEIHSDIKNDIEKSIGKEKTVLIHKSIDEFISKIDSDKEASSTAIKKALISNSLSKFCLWDWVAEGLNQSDALYDVDDINWAGFPCDAEGGRIVSSELISLDVPRVIYDGNLYIVYCDVGFVGEFECDILMAEASQVIPPQQLEWIDESDDLWAQVALQSVGSVMFRLEFDIGSQSVTKSDSITIEHWNSYGDLITEIDALAKDENL
ncbi:PIN domain-containing protein [Bacterioplanoides sp.]|uniref:PIN domain-containing protein n=1 Tax=Bacterioplanoides sp. TaxID=2066072 RepID=UPI003AFF9679